MSCSRRARARAHDRGPKALTAFHRRCGGRGLGQLGHRHRLPSKQPVAFEDTIRPGCSVTIATPQGQERTGRAVMRGKYGWVLNLGGRHGTPGIATPSNTLRVRCKRG